MGQDFEFYETPEPSGRYLFGAIDIRGRCFEPCVGAGAILRASESSEWTPKRRHWTTNDLDTRWAADSHEDATSVKLWDDVACDWTVSNTPFSLAVEIADHALMHSSVGVALYLRISIHEVLRTGVRKTWFAEHPPSQIHFLPRFAHQRSQKTGKWSTDSVTTCWTIWRHGDTNQRIVYAPGSLADELKAYEPAYRARMDALMASRVAA